MAWIIAAGAMVRDCSSILASGVGGGVVACSSLRVLAVVKLVLPPDGPTVDSALPCGSTICLTERFHQNAHRSDGILEGNRLWIVVANDKPAIVLLLLLSYW